MKLIKASDVAFLRLKEATEAARTAAPALPLTDRDVLVWLGNGKPVKGDPREAWRSLFKET